MFRLAAPQWLFLLPLLMLVAWQVPRLKLVKPWRAVCLLLLTLYLAQPEWRWRPPGVDLWLLMDRSASAADLIEPRRAEIEQLLDTNKGADDRLIPVDFAAAPVRRGDAMAFEASPLETRLRLAVDYVLSLRESGRSTRLLAVTDGASTEDLGGLAKKLRAAGAELDLRILTPGAVRDFRLEGVRAPQRVRPGEAFLLEARVSAAVDEPVAYEVRSDGELLGKGTAEIRGGAGRIRVTARSVRPGARRYEVRLLPTEDARPGNNVASAWVEVSEGPNVLLVTGYQDDPLAATLQAQGIRVETVTDLSTLDAGFLSGPRAVVLNNVPAHKIPSEFLRALEFFVTSQGGGLFMAGGQFSFGAGGYFQSPVDPLLPVSMELRQEHRKLAVAMAIVLDRSGSMAAAAGPGATKMDLANEGAARAVELLGPSDAVTVFAVDSAAHVVVPLTSVGQERPRISSEVRRIQSSGGGIFVYTGLEAAWKELEKAQVGQKHIILFADAADAEEPGEFRKLIGTMREQGATVSVIGMGTPQDSDAALLEEIGQLGGGRVFFNADASQLPGLFAQETVAVARSAFLSERVTVVDAGGWLELASRPMDWLAAVDGYNLSYLKPGAGVAAVSGDEYQAPLVAFWQRGAGRTAAVSFPLAGKFSESFRQWTGAGDFEQTLVRWLLPGQPAAGIGLKTRVEGSDVVLELLHDSSWTAKLAENPPRVILAEGVEGTPYEATWEKIEPGRYAVRTPLPPGRWLRGVVQAGSERWPFGPVAAGVDPEWELAPGRLQDLREASVESGGRELADLREAWRPATEPDYVPLATWVLTALLLSFLVEVAVSRWQGGA